MNRITNYEKWYPVQIVRDYLNLATASAFFYAIIKKLYYLFYTPNFLKSLESDELT